VNTQKFCIHIFPISQINIELFQMSLALPEPARFHFILQNPFLITIIKNLSLIKNNLMLIIISNVLFILINTILLCINNRVFESINQYSTGLFVSCYSVES